MPDTAGQIGEMLGILKSVEKRLESLENANKAIEDRRVSVAEAIGRNRGRIDTLTDRHTAVASEVSLLRERLDSMEKEMVREEGRRVVAAKLGAGGVATGLLGILIGGWARLLDVGVIVSEAVTNPPPLP